MQLAFQDFLGRKFREILTDPDSSLIQSTEGDAFLSPFGTENQPEGSFFAGILFVLFQPAQVKLHLSLIGSFELAEFQFFCGAAGYVRSAKRSAIFAPFQYSNAT